MKAPTNIYGPDGTLVKKGGEIPPGWFDELPDLQQHLDAVEVAPDPETDVDAAAAAKSRSIKAKAELGRKRGSK